MYNQIDNKKYHNYSNINTITSQIEVKYKYHN